MTPEDLRAIEGAIEEWRKRIAEKVADGGVADWTAYKALVGERKGLREALDIVREVAAAQANDDDGDAT